MRPHAAHVNVIRSRVPLGLVRVAAWLLLTVLAVAPLFIWGTDVYGLVIALSFDVVGLILVARRPRQPTGWLLILAGASFVAVGTFIAGSASDIVDGQTSLRITVQGWLNSAGAPVFFGSFVALAATFPSGRFPAGRLGLIARATVALPIAFVVVLAFAPDLTVWFLDGSTGTVSNPVGLAPGWAGWPILGVAVYLAVLVALLVSIAIFIIRFRRARDIERQQGKWLLASLAAVLATVVFAFAVILLVDANGTWMWSPAVITYPLVPIAIGIAVLRYRLYEIDRIISRTIGWAITSGAIVAVFAVLVVGLQALLAPLTGEDTLAVAASTLVAAALFAPVRSRVQRAADRRFDRARYDAERIAAALAERLRDQTDLGAIHADVIAAVDGSLRPARLGLWVREE